MTASEDLLRRIEADTSLAAALAEFSDFDIGRRDPIDDLLLPAGTPLRPVAGSGDGGTYFQCGDDGDNERRIVYADSEGRATLLGDDLVEAVTLVVVLPFWEDLARGFEVGELGSEIRADRPDFDSRRDSLLRALALPRIPEEEAVARLMSVAGDTDPNYLPRVVGDDNARYELLFGSDPDRLQG